MNSFTLKTGNKGSQKLTELPEVSGALGKQTSVGEH